MVVKGLVRVNSRLFIKATDGGGDYYQEQERRLDYYMFV